MRFSLLYEHQLPRPWEADDEHRVLREAIEQVRLADRLGYHGVWAGGHQLLEEFAHSSAPEVFLAACSQVTETIRLGLGGVALPPGYQHPARVAEAAATLDLVSDGRVELATAETTTGAELGGFAIDRDSRRAQWAEALEIVARMMVEEPFAGAAGRHVAMPPRNVVPKPRQQPHPPLWVACSRRDMIHLAAEKGLGALGLTFLEPDEAQPVIDDYYATIASDRCVPAGFAVNANVAIALPMLVHADEAEAVARGIDGAHFFAYALGHYAGFGQHEPGRTSIWDDFLRRREDVGFARSIITAENAPLDVKVLKGGLASLRGAIGTPDQLRELLRRYEEAGVDELVFCMQTGRTEHAHILESMELFARDVMPEFVERDAAHVTARRARLGDALQRALTRRPAAPAVAPGYAFGPEDGAAAPASAEPAASAAPASAVHAHAPAPPRATPTLAARLAPLRAAAEAHGERALQTFVKRSDDRRLERTIGSRPALKIVFAAMERQFVPERAGDFAGDIQYNLRAADGTVTTWTVTIGSGKARAHPGAAQADPKLTLTLSLADFIRLAGRDLDPVKAVLTGRLDLAGDFTVAMRLGEMFGQSVAV